MKLPQKKHIPLFLISGAFGYVIYTVAMNIGLQTLPSATCSLLVATSPIMTAIIAERVYHEKINAVSWCAIFIAFAGVAILLLWDSGGAFKIETAMLWMLQFRQYNAQDLAHQVPISCCISFMKHHLSEIIRLK